MRERDVAEGRVVGPHVGELAAQVADAVAAGAGGELDRAEDAERLPGRVDERAARVTRDPGRDGLWVSVPVSPTVGI